MKKPLLIILTGPTAVGKTSLSVRLAAELSTAIISADSRQFYREMKIGTATPDAEEQRGVPHYFLGHLSVNDSYNVSGFENDVIAFLEKYFRERNSIIMTGGSGLYIDAVCNGIDELPDPDPEIRSGLKDDLQKYGIAYLQEKLAELDHEYFDAVDINNPNRLLRALEVCLMTGKKYSSMRSGIKKARPFRILKIGLYMDRDELNSRIDARVDDMIRKGLVDEARSLLPYRNLNALNTVGYRELFSCFDGKCSMEEAVEKIKTNSRRYAKRQMTWFRKDNEINWFDAASDDTFERVMELIKKEL